MSHRWTYTNLVEYWQRKPGGRKYRRFVHDARCEVCGWSMKCLGHIPRRFKTPEAKAKFMLSITVAMDNAAEMCKVVCHGDPPLPPDPPEKYIPDPDAPPNVIKFIRNPACTS